MTAEIFIYLNLCKKGVLVNSEENTVFFSWPIILSFLVVEEVFNVFHGRTAALYRTEVTLVGAPLIRFFQGQSRLLEI